MTKAQKHPNVVHLDDVDGMSRTQGTRFGLLGKRLGGAAGARDLGCMWFEVLPGRTAFPAHYHCATEEAVFVLEGEGIARIGDAEVPIRAGCFISYPIGPDHAHLIKNTGEGPLRYLCMSTMHTADVVGYPDSNKVAAIAGPRDGDWTQRWVASWYPAGVDVGYYDGEDTGE